MALGEFKLFQMKSKKQREKEAKEYALWAFPYGDEQRDKLTALILEYMPKASMPIFLSSFLTCKELYEGVLEDCESREAAVDKMINSLRNYGQLIKGTEMPMYLAFVLADADIDEKCEYPSVDEIRARIQELTDMKTEKKLNLFKKKSTR